MSKYINADDFFQTFAELVISPYIDFPAADVCEVVHGEWIDHSENGYVECPICHSITTCDDNIEELHFCFSCGAKLRGGTE